MGDGAALRPTRRHAGWAPRLYGFLSGRTAVFASPGTRSRSSLHGSKPRSRASLAPRIPSLEPPGAFGSPLCRVPSRHLSRDDRAGAVVCYGPRSSLPKRATAIWLILPVVICLSQRLSHACLSTNRSHGETANGSLDQLWFIRSYKSYLDNCGNSRANTCNQAPTSREERFY